MRNDKIAEVRRYFTTKDKIITDDYNMPKTLPVNCFK